MWKCFPSLFFLLPMISTIQTWRSGLWDNNTVRCRWNCVIWLCVNHHGGIFLLRRCHFLLLKLPFPLPWGSHNWRCSMDTDWSLFLASTGWHVSTTVKDVTFIAGYYALGVGKVVMERRYWWTGEWRKTHNDRDSGFREGNKYKFADKVKVDILVKSW